MTNAKNTDLYGRDRSSTLRQISAQADDGVVQKRVRPTRSAHGYQGTNPLELAPVYQKVGEILV